MEELPERRRPGSPGSTRKFQGTPTKPLPEWVTAGREYRRSSPLGRTPWFTGREQPLAEAQIRMFSWNFGTDARRTGGEWQ